MIDWSQCADVESIPGKLSGAWVFKHIRLPVSALFENLAHGAIVHEFIEWFPGVDEAQVLAVLNFDAQHSRYQGKTSDIARRHLRILFDHCIPAPLRRSLQSHSVKLAAEMGWQDLSNGELISSAERAAFELLMSTDQNIRYQQNLSDRRIALLVLPIPEMARVKAARAENFRRG